jgi:hypothetical protein
LVLVLEREVVLDADRLRVGDFVTVRDAVKDLTGTDIKQVAYSLSGIHTPRLGATHFNKSTVINPPARPKCGIMRPLDSP